MARPPVACSGPFVARFVALLLAGCGGGGGGSGGGTGPAATYDVALGSSDGDTVSLFFDVLGQGPAPAPSVVLDAIGSQIDQPESVVLDGTRLVVASRGNSKILVWDDYTTLTDGQAPDRVFTEAISPRAIVVSPAGDLIATSTSGIAGEVKIWRTYATKASGAPADVFLNQFGSSVDSPHALAVAANRLYVGCIGNSLVLGFYDLAGLVSQQAPSATLDEGTGGVVEPRRVRAIDDQLYVTQPGDKSATPVTRFGPLVALGGGNAPSASLGLVSSVEGGGDVAGFAGHLFVGNDLGTGLLRFAAPGPVATDETPVGSVSDAEGVPAVAELATADTVLVAALQNDKAPDDGFGGLAVWANGATLAAGTAPDVLVTGLAYGRSRAVAVRKR